MITQGHLLGGRVRYSQPEVGFRSGLEPVLLAASVPAKPGERLLEAGTGAGAALLCLLARVAGVLAVGVEIDPGLADLARANAAANGYSDMQIVVGCIESVALAGPFDHAIANPPYHAAGGTISAVAARETAKRGSAELIDRWIARLSSALRSRGSLTLSVPAGIMPACLAAMTRHDCACSAIFPLWPKAGRPAKLVLLRGVKAGRTPTRLMSGFVLHRADGSFTDAAQELFHAGGALAVDP